MSTKSTAFETGTTYAHYRSGVTLVSGRGWELTTDLMPTMRKLVAFADASTEVAAVVPSSREVRPIPSARPASGVTAAPESSWSDTSSTWPFAYPSDVPASRPSGTRSAPTVRAASCSAAPRAARVPGFVFALVGFVLSCSAAWLVKEHVAHRAASIDAALVSGR